MGPCRRTVAPGPATPAPFPSICRTRAREAHARVRLLRDGMLRASAKVCHVPRVHAQLGLSSRSPSLGGYARGEGECRRARPRVRVSAAWSGAGSGYMKYMECAWGGFVRVCWGRDVVVGCLLGFSGVRWGSMATVRSALSRSSGGKTWLQARAWTDAHVVAPLEPNWWRRVT